MTSDARGLFVTGTDTGVGKTVLAAAIVAALRATGIDATACKPVITGLDDPPDPDWPPDHELLAAAAACSPELVCRIGYGRPVSPHLAAELSGERLEPRELIEAIADAATGHEAVIVEGVGGLLVPLSDEYTVRDLAAELGLPVVIASRPGLGTISHTLLTVEAARRADLDVIAVVLTPWPEQPDAIMRSNRATIERIARVEVSALPLVARAEPELLAAAGRRLVPERWLAGAVPSLAIRAR